MGIILLNIDLNLHSIIFESVTPVLILTNITPSKSVISKILIKENQVMYFNFNNFEDNITLGQWN